MEMHTKHTSEKGICKRRIYLSQLLWIGAAALILGYMEAVFLHNAGREASWLAFLFAALGQAAKPLLLYCFVENLKLCKKPLRFILYLLAGGIIASVLLLILNLVFSVRLGLVTPENLMFEFFYILLFILSLESVLDWKRSGFKKHTLLFPAMLIVTFCLNCFSQRLGDMIPSRLAAPFTQRQADGFRLFFRVLFFPDASMRGLIPLACVWYYAKRKRTQCWALAGYCLFTVLMFYAQFIDVFGVYGLFNNVIPMLLGDLIADGIQVFGLIAIPFICLYERRESEALSLRKHGFLMLLYPILTYALHAI